MPVSEKKKASNARWDAEHIRRMSLAVPVELYGKMVNHVQQTKDKSINAFLNRAIVETIERDNESGGGAAP